MLKAQHYLQACAQGAVLVYWGWYWRPVYDYAHLIVAQLLFAYAFDMLLSWTRRGVYTLGFGPFPVIFSINLFLWFRPDYFFFQFLMVAVGFAAKELLRWDKDGRRVHIFNPSSFPLAVFALALLLSGRSGLTWGQEIATTQFYPPYMYLFIFLIGLPGQLAFGVTTMTCSAVVSAYLFGLAYYATTGVYFFYDSYIPIAVFLGMHLLFTDPSTSPRTEFGRVIYGVLYGVSTVALYQLLGTMGLPTFYDKLLQVPILNLSVRAIDRIAVRARAFDPTAIARALAPTSTSPCLCLDLDDGVRRDQRRRRSGRRPSWPVAALLETGVRGRAAARVPLRDRRAGGVLRPGIEVGLQRRGERCARRREQRAADARRLSDRPSRQQGSGPRAHASRTNGSRLPARLGARLRRALSPTADVTSYFFCAPGVSSCGAPVPDEPMNILRPSAKVMSRPLARRDPSLAR